MAIPYTDGDAHRRPNELVVTALHVVKTLAENLLEQLEPSEVGTAAHNGQRTGPSSTHRERPLVDAEFQVGEQVEGEVISIRPDRGFVLFEIPRRVFTPLLHYTNMTQEFRDDLNRGDSRSGSRSFWKSLRWTEPVTECWCVICPTSSRKPRAR
jgi:hypothetical protein